MAVESNIEPGRRRLQFVYGIQREQYPGAMTGTVGGNHRASPEGLDGRKGRRVGSTGVGLRESCFILIASS